VRYSLDSGDSWTEEDQLTFSHGVFANRVLWQGDSIHIAWEDWRYSQRDIFYMLSTDNGLTWGDEMRVEDNPESSGFPDIAVVGDNRHLVWYDRRDDLGNGIYYSRWDQVSEIPTLSEWGMLIMVLLLLALGTLAVASTRNTALKVERR
jgi:hypothetical protein